MKKWIGFSHKGPFGHGTGPFGNGTGYELIDNKRPPGNTEMGLPDVTNVMLHLISIIFDSLQTMEENFVSGI
jgi:hypothetical protein